MGDDRSMLVLVGSLSFRLLLSFCCFEIGSYYKAQGCLKLWFSCLILPSAGVTDLTFLFSPQRLQEKLAGQLLV